MNVRTVHDLNIAEYMRLTCCIALRLAWPVDLPSLLSQLAPEHDVYWP